MQIYFQYPAGGERSPRLEMIELTSASKGRGFTIVGKKKSHPFTKRYPSLPTSESCFWHLGSLCHLRHLIFKWRSFMAELSWQCWQNDWGEHAVLLSVLGAFWREGVLYSGDRALLALPWSAQLRAVCSFSPPHLKAQKEFVQGDTVLGTSRWSWGCMEPHLLPWVPECEQECHLFIPLHVPGPATELVSVQINCPINTYLFNQQVTWALWKPQMFLPCICKDICMGLFLYVLKSPGSHFLWTFVFFLYSPRWLGDQCLLLTKELPVQLPFIFILSFLGSRA